jgi:single-strand DNA-binding protein
MIYQNKVTLQGYLGADPEIRTTQAGKKMATISIGLPHSSGNKDEQKASWHRTNLLNDQQVEIAEKYLKKGSRVFIEGVLENRSWKGKDGKDKYSTEIVLVGKNAVLEFENKKPVAKEKNA